MEIVVGRPSLEPSLRYEGPIERVVLQFAMRAEAAPIIDHFGLHYYSAVDRLPHLLFARGRAGSLDLHIVVHGEDSRYKVDRVGTEAATLAAFKAIEITNPSLLINAGTAGGFKERGGNIGDVYLSSGVVFHDHRIPLGAYQDYGVGRYPVVSPSKLAQQIGARRGVISTGNSLDVTPADFASFRDTGADVKDMEAAAIAQVALGQNVPFLAIKVITDLVDEPCNVGEVFVSNLESASRALSNKALSLIHTLNEFGRLENL